MRFGRGQVRALRCRRLAVPLVHWGMRSVSVVEVLGPLVHEPPPPLEQVRAGVGRLNLVLHDVGHRRLNYLARMIRLFGRPIPERRAEAVRDGDDSHGTGASSAASTSRSASRSTWGTAAGAGHRRAPAPHRESPAPPAERNTMLSFRLHPRRGDRPHGAGWVDFVPRRQPDLAGPCRRQYEASLTAGCADFVSPHRLNRGGHVLVRQRLSVRHDVVLRAEHRQDAVAGIVVP